MLILRYRIWNETDYCNNNCNGDDFQKAFKAKVTHPCFTNHTLNSHCCKTQILHGVFKSVIFKQEH